jgi:hypothetical protein
VKLSDAFLILLGQLKIEPDQLTARIEQMDEVLWQTVGQIEACQRLTSIPGIGPVTATALVAAIGNGSGFRRGRGLAAWVGRVDKEVPGTPGQLLRQEPLPDNLILLKASKGIRVLYTSTDGVDGKTPIAVSVAIYFRSDWHPRKGGR